MKNSISHDGQTDSNKTDAPDFEQAINYTLYDIANAINTTHNLKHLYHSIYNSLNKLMGLPNFFIALYDEQTRMITFEYFIDEYDENFPIIESKTGPNSLTGEVIQARRPLLLKENILIERTKNSRLVGTTPKIWLGVPLMIQNRIIGVISIQHYTNSEYFSHRHLETLVCASELLSMAMERIQFFEKLENEKEILHIIADHTHSIIFTINSTGIYQFANPSHIILGYHPDDIINTSFFDLVHPDNIRDLLEFIEKGIQGRIFQDSFVFGLKDKSGIFHTLEGMFNIIRNSESILEKIIFVGHFIQEKTDKPLKEIRLPLNQKRSVPITAESFCGQLKNVLLIEDDETVRATTARALKISGYNPLEACDGERGIAIYKVSYHSIDAVFLDIILPGISGRDVFKEILRINPLAKIIITSGHVTSQDQQKIFSNASAFIEKPYGIMIIKETLNKIFEENNEYRNQNSIHLIPF